MPDDSTGIIALGLFLLCLNGIGIVLFLALRKMESGEGGGK